MLRDGRIFGRKTSGFTLQWHLTNACELSCQHCYDRSRLGHLSASQAEGVLLDLVAFCQEFQLKGQACLTGGNPFLYPHFLQLYRAIANTECSTSILGNPVPESWLSAIVGLRKPNYFQVSLEGLPDYNDQIRGPGHFKRVMEFLPLLRKWKIRSHVMLTLHEGNLHQVIALAGLLRGQVDRFSFNRLAQVGSGQGLSLPRKVDFVDLLRRYTDAACANPHLHFKDGLFNILRSHFHHPRTRGCTGFGCGAAFNFMAVLPNGEVHACRKFPSLIGNLLTSSLANIYSSPAARRYRMGCRECRFCRLRNICGGCLAVAHGAGLDELRRRDPHCFQHERNRFLRST